MLFGVLSLKQRETGLVIIWNNPFLLSFFETKHPNEGTIAEMRDYEGR